jgi:hypothetical protein
MLGSMEAMECGGVAELLARLDYARAALAAWEQRRK